MNFVRKCQLFNVIHARITFSGEVSRVKKTIISLSTVLLGFSALMAPEVSAGVTPATPAASIYDQITHQISTAQAIQLAQKFLGPTVASHMLHRVITPTVPQDPNMRYSTISASSSNWSGYYVQGSGLKGAQASFNSVSDTTGDVAPWVGIGGVGNSELIQTGIDDSLQREWYQMLPSNPVYVFNVHPGDKISATVSYDNSTGLWYIDIADLTTNVYYANEFSYTANESTADFILESPYPHNPGNPATTYFSSAYWENSSSLNESLGSAGTLYKETLSNQYGYLVPSAISGGTNFSVSYQP